MNVVENNGQIHIFKSIKISKELSNKNYYLRFSRLSCECFLENARDFSIPEKLYDIEKEFRSIILKSFNNNNSNTGVLLEGYKGQGKSMTSKLLCLETKLPVIIIDTKIPKSINFASFLNSIDQKLVIFIDEFEKLFPTAGYGDKDDHNQDSFLSLMDGSLTSVYKKLFILTTNSNIQDTFINRPSRIKFRKIYDHLDKNLYNMIIDDLLINKDYKKDLLDNLDLTDATIDLLISIINEINIIEKPYSYFKSFFNHSPRNFKYELYMLKNDKYEKVETIFVKKPINRFSHSVGDYYIENVITSNDESLIFLSYSKFNFPDDPKDSDGNFINNDGENVLYTYKIVKGA